MSKKLISLLLAVMLTFSMAVVAISSVSASTVANDVDGISTPDVAEVESTTKAPAKIQPKGASAPYLTVNATSNAFGSSKAEYNAETKQVVVTYNMSFDDSVYRMINFQFCLNYDSSVLKLNSIMHDEDEDIDTMFPGWKAQDGYMINLKLENQIRLNGSNVNKMYRLTEGIFFRIIFDVQDISAVAPAVTTVDMNLEVMNLEKYNPETHMVDENAEKYGYAQSSIINDDVAQLFDFKTGTDITPSTFVPDETEVPTTEAPTTEAPTTVAPTTEAPTTVAPTTVAPTTEAPTTEAPTTAEPTTDAPTTAEPTTVAPTTEEPFNGLNITGTSNLFPADTYKAQIGDTVTVDYNLGSKNVLNTQWELNYDPAVLKLVSNDFMPQMADGSFVNTDTEGVVSGSAVNLKLFKVTGEKPFVTATFEVIGKGDTTVSLNVSRLQVSEIDPVTGMNDETKEESIVTNSVVDTTKDYTADTVIHSFAEPTTVAPTTVEPTTVAPTTAEPTTVAPTTAEPATGEPTTAVVPATDGTSATSTQPTNHISTSDTPAAPNGNGTVQTGEVSMAVIILTILIAATGAMLVLRKKEMF